MMSKVLDKLDEILRGAVKIDKAKLRQALEYAEGEFDDLELAQSLVENRMEAIFAVEYTNMMAEIEEEKQNLRDLKGA